MCRQLFLGEMSGFNPLTGWCGSTVWYKRWCLPESELLPPKILMTFYSVVVASYLGAWFPASPCVCSVFQGTLPLSVLVCAALLLVNMCAPSS